MSNNIEVFQHPEDYDLTDNTDVALEVCGYRRLSEHEAEAADPYTRTLIATVDGSAFESGAPCRVTLRFPAGRFVGRDWGDIGEALARMHYDEQFPRPKAGLISALRALGVAISQAEETFCWLPDEDERDRWERIMDSDHVYTEDDAGDIGYLTFADGSVIRWDGWCGTFSLSTTEEDA